MRCVTFAKTPEIKIMRKLLVLFSVLLLVAGILEWICETRPKRSFGDVLREVVNTYPLAEYRDTAFGFTMPYPTFMSREDAKNDHFIGGARFSYWGNWVKITMECHVSKDRKELTTAQTARIIAARLRASKVKTGRNDFVIDGKMYDGEQAVEGYSYRRKYVRGRGVWYVCTLYYPAQYRNDLARLLRLVDSWTAHSSRNVPDENTIYGY